MKLNVSHVETRTVDSAVAAQPVALEYLERGLLVITEPASNDEEDFRWKVTAYELHSGTW